MYLFTLATLITSIASTGGSQPDRQPSIAAVPGLTAIVFGNGNSAWIATSKDEGQHFSARTEVARVPTLALGRHRGPRVAISGSTLVVTAVYGDKAAAGPHGHGLPSDGDLVAWRSKDGGHSWTKPVVINDVPGSAREGLHAFAAAPNGWLAAVWLDLRSPGTRLMGAYSRDGGATWSPNTLLYDVPGGTICQCCAPSIVFDEHGTANVMFRNAMNGRRDLFLLHWDLGGKPTEVGKLGTGSWILNACPMDGGGIARLGDSVITAWRRDKTVYLAQPGKAETPIGEGKDVALATGRLGAYAVWTGAPGVELHEPGENKPRLLSTAGQFPAIAPLPNGSVLVAWEDDGRIKLEAVK